MLVSLNCSTFHSVRPEGVVLGFNPVWLDELYLSININALSRTYLPCSDEVILYYWISFLVKDYIKQMMHKNSNLKYCWWNGLSNFTTLCRSLPIFTLQIWMLETRNLAHFSSSWMIVFRKSMIVQVNECIKCFGSVLTQLKDHSSLLLGLGICSIGRELCSKSLRLLNLCLF